VFNSLREAVFYFNPNNLLESVMIEKDSQDPISTREKIAVFLRNQRFNIGLAISLGCGGTSIINGYQVYYEVEEFYKKLFLNLALGGFSPYIGLGAVYATNFIVLALLHNTNPRRTSRFGSSKNPA